MKLHEAIGLELERREKVMDDCEKAHRAWAKSLPPTSINRTYGDVWKAAWDYQQARINALTAEIEEQARLLGASGSREAELLARVEALEKKLTKVYNALLAGIANAAAANYAEREMEAKRRLRDAMQEPSP